MFNKNILYIIYTALFNKASKNATLDQTASQLYNVKEMHPIVEVKRLHVVLSADLLILHVSVDT